MKYQLSIVILLSSVFLLAGCSSKPEDPTPAVVAINQVFVENFLKGDEKAIAALYTEDAKVFPPGMPIAAGRPEIAKLMRNFMDAEYKDLTIKTLEVFSSGDMAYEDAVVTLIDKDGSPTSSRSIVVWKRVDGKWHLHRDMWNEGK